MSACSPDGEERYAGVTQFEATDARRCFPCWDEPAIKATFDITLIVPQSKTALSNMVSKVHTFESVVLYIYPLKINDFRDVMPCSPVVLTPVLHRYLLPHFCATKLEAVGTSGMSVTSYQLTWRCIPQDINLNVHCHGNPNSHKHSLIFISSFRAVSILNCHLYFHVCVVSSSRYRRRKRTLISS